MKAKRQTLPPFKLKELTCEQLYDIIVNEPAGPERKQLRDIRAWFKNMPDRLNRLLLCRQLPAHHFRQHMLTAIHLRNVPEIEMTIGGGQPKKESMPPFSASLKKMGAMNGLVIHRWGKGAFILKKKAPSALEEE